MVMQSGRYSRTPNRTYTRIDARLITGGRNVSINIGNGSIDIDEYVGRDSHHTATITVGGVQATPEQLDGFKARLQHLEAQIEEAAYCGEIDEERAAEARAVFDEFTEEVTQPRRPRQRRLVTAGRVLLRFSPLIAGAMISVLSDPLMGEIAQQAGDAAVRLVEHALGRNPGPAHTT